MMVVDLPVVGDAAQAFEMLLAEPVVQNNTENDVRWRKDEDVKCSYDKKERAGVAASVSYRCIGELTGGDAVVRKHY